jgi:hypothetical protein
VGETPPPSASNPSAWSRTPNAAPLPGNRSGSVSGFGLGETPPPFQATPRAPRRSFNPGSCPWRDRTPPLSLGWPASHHLAS